VIAGSFSFKMGNEDEVVIYKRDGERRVCHLRVAVARRLDVSVGTVFAGAPRHEKINSALTVAAD
jgi:hypothetical protein